MYSQSYLLNRVLLEIRSSFVISRTFSMRFWFSLGSLLCIGSLFTFWTFTLAPRPLSPQVQVWCTLARLQAPILAQLRYDYAAALNQKNFSGAATLQDIAQLIAQGSVVSAELYILEKKKEREYIEQKLGNRTWRHLYQSLAILCLSPLCFMNGFLMLRRYLRWQGYRLNGRLLFFRIATPSVFKLGALLFWGYMCFLSYQIWTPSYWNEPSISSSVSEKMNTLSWVKWEKLKSSETERTKIVLQSYWIQSLLFYGFVGSVLWLLGRRWDQLPCKEMPPYLHEN